MSAVSSGTPAVTSAVDPFFSASLIYKLAASPVQTKPVDIAGNLVSRIKFSDAPYPILPAGSTIFTQTLNVPSVASALSAVVGIALAYPVTLLQVAEDEATT